MQTTHIRQQLRHIRHPHTCPYDICVDGRSVAEMAHYIISQRVLR